MYVEEQGPEGGVPIVFLHGSMVAGWMWTEQVAALADDHRTIVPDLPGIGASASDRWTGFAGAADSVAAEITARAPDGAHVVGLSLGGIVALNLAVTHPECCRSLLVSGVPAGQLSAPLRMLNRAMASIYGTAFGSRLIGRIFGLPDQESMDAFVATARATDRSAIRAIIAEVSSKPLPDRLDHISVPVLSVVGERDTEPAKRAVPLLMTSIPGSRGAHVPGVGHQWNAEAPALFAEMVRRWVDEQEIHPDLVPIDSGQSPGAG
jgi:pimeloyl-ACP methyl ester carboxylesterase